jgi:hypothetical protein
MKALGPYLAASAIALAAWAGAAGSRAEAQPFGRGYERAAEHDRGRGGGQREYRGGGERRGQTYAPAPRGYASPPAYAYPRQTPPPQAYEPRTYEPRAYPPRGYPAQSYPPQGYAAPQAYPAQRGQPQPYAAPPPGYGAAPAPGRNSLGAYWGQQQDAARRGVQQGGMAPLSTVTGNISRIAPGRMLDAGIEPGPDGRPAYRVRWAAAGGRRIDFIVDAATGAIIGQSGY